MHEIIMNVTCTCTYWYLTPHEYPMILPALGISAAPLLLVWLPLLLHIALALHFGVLQTYDWPYTGQRLNIVGTIWKKLSKLVFTLYFQF